ncbi:TcpE family conjugal transfer membrane protein [Anaerovorax sp. IOR16]|uniref:TcpE family conjugal transfer membrane protein n=1 Tax=Anaerovorax sp. IOR16 TaxID=2773458 RepID=UPI0019D0FA83|nr:TcpE family conjugal transfer membrane protein [Anaerovorax sp. IOR16]
MEDKLLLRTYNKAWKFERKVYAIDNIRLPFPINPDELIYLVIGFLFTLLLLKVLPFLNTIPFFIRYLVIPYGLMKFLTKKKFDGKLPHMFLIGYLDYIGLPKKIARFQAVKTYPQGKFSPVVFRTHEIINLTEELVFERKSKKSRKGKQRCTNSR